MWIMITVLREGLKLGLVGWPCLRLLGWTGQGVGLGSVDVEFDNCPVLGLGLDSCAVLLGLGSLGVGLDSCAVLLGLVWLGVVLDS